MIYNEITIINKFSDNLKMTSNCLKELDFCFDKNGVSFKGLTGWVFEQTILKCIRDEFGNSALIYTIGEQFKLSKLIIAGKKCRGQADLVVKINDNTYLIEIKHTGIFSANDCEKYLKYKKIIEDNNYKYLYLTKGESYLKFKNICKEMFGENNSFFLDEEGSWKNFINLLTSR